MKQGSEIGEQGTKDVEELLREVLTPVGELEPEKDLWPAMLRRMDARMKAPPWIDWALACGVAVFALTFPAAIPVFLYYL